MIFRFSTLILIHSMLRFSASGEKKVSPENRVRVSQRLTELGPKMGLLSHFSLLIANDSSKRGRSSVAIGAEMANLHFDPTTGGAIHISGYLLPTAKDLSM